MKQYMSILCLLMAISGKTLARPVDEESELMGDCPGGLINGAILERGQFFYECRDGDIVPKGCYNDQLKRVEIGATVDRTRYRLMCQLGSDGILSYEPISCLFNGVEHKIDEVFEDGINFYTCKRTDAHDLRSVVSGCLDNGKRLNLNEKVTKEDFVFVCNETVNNGAHLMPTACVKEGREYNVGDKFEIGKSWFTCTRTGREKLAVKNSGCVSNGKRLNDGDRFNENDVVYECTIEAEKIDVRATACIQNENGNTIERKLGCTWVEGEVPLQYEWRCDHDASSNTAKKVQVRCNYNPGNGIYGIEAGCYRLIDESAFGCLQEGSSLRLQAFEGENAEQSASSAGLRAC